MSITIDKKYICISVKLSYYQKNGWWLWGNNKSGYVGESWKAGLYTEKDFDYDYARFPVVKMYKDLTKFCHKRYDSVLVDKEDFVKFTDEKQQSEELIKRAEIRQSANLEQTEKSA